MDKESADLDKRLDGLGQEIAAAEKAKQKIDSIKVRAQEIDKQLNALSGRRTDNNNRKIAFKKMQKKQEEAEKKALARKEDLKKYSKLDT